MNLSDTTFVYASLNNGYDNNPNDPVPNYHLERTAFSVNSLKERWNANIVFVDWCSQNENKFQSKLSQGVTYAHVHPKVIDKLHEGNDSTQLFYEWISKDIGATFVDTKYVIFINNDILISKTCMETIVNTECDNKTWITINRANIDNKIFTDPNLYDIIDETPDQLNILDVCTFCHGDFTACTTELYEKVGGYPYIHKHAYGDHLLMYALNAHNSRHIHISHAPIYHLNHKSKGSSNVFSENPIDKLQIKQFIIQNTEVIKL